MLAAAGLRISTVVERREERNPTSGADFLAFLTRTMGDFYWSTLSDGDARRLRAGIAERVDGAIAQGDFAIPNVGAIIVASRPLD